MNDRFVESREALSYARQALKNGSMTEARQWAERAAELAPQSEDPWLVMAAVATSRAKAWNISAKRWRLTRIACVKGDGMGHAKTWARRPRLELARKNRSRPQLRLMRSQKLQQKSIV